ncbi:DUF4238 domain-containing protein [Mesoterricola silvestris]|uniref:DUF4238 domain-containing protein n=1 Tax=Mesoterricola silvestris TaxID=2927979 RepID=A0AA48GTE3_9BACT|nr:DUF4238 domain-containing protein [Mesoterricola silvestris]BDU71416.1 hypothetical protein METEAL_05900 [Mesoterricola silvestris]
MIINHPVISTNYGTSIHPNKVTPEVRKHLAKRQHYVPQCLLRRFAIPNTDGEPKIHFYDKKLGVEGISTIHDVASKKGYYNFIEDGEIYTLEIGFGKIEAAIDRIIETVIRKRSIGHLTPKDRVVIADYLIKQLLRTPRARADAKAMLFAMEKGLESKGVELREAFSDYEPLTDDRVNKLAIDQLRGGRLSPELLLDKAWMLLETTNSDPFITSDHPVVRINNRAIKERWQRGSRGLRSPYVEISFPLSPTLCLSLVSKEHVAEIWIGYQEILRLERRAPAQAFFLWEAKILAETLMDGMTSGNAHSIGPDAVMNINSAQCHDCFRQVFSAASSFSLPKQMRMDGCFQEDSNGQWVWQ